MRTVALGLLIIAGLCPIWTAGPTEQVDGSLHVGTITGRVVDTDGNPVANARVMAIKEQPGPVRSEYTDVKGRFKLEYVKIEETYLMDASKMEEGYTYTCGLFLDCPSRGTCPQVTLTSGKPDAEVTIRFGPKGGYVAGTVGDATTGGPIADATITFYGQPEMGKPSTSKVRSDSRGGFLSETLPLCPIRMKVEAPGYRTWYYNGAGSEAAAQDLTVASGKTKQITVLLTPE